MSFEIPSQLNWWQYYTLAFKLRRSPYVDHYLGNRKVLDIGCGEGAMLARYTTWQGIDIDPNLVGRCREKGLPAQVMSALEMSFPEGEFEGVHASQLIEHFSPNQAFQFLRETARVLRPGGVLFMTTPGVKRVWNTFSHVRPYPPAAISKVLNVSTEGYIGDARLPLKLLAFHATRAGIGFLGSLLPLLDPIFPSDDPDGWVIVCTRI